MRLLKLWRTFKEGLTNFFRNGWLSVATISVLTISLYIISFTFVLGITANLILKNVEDKVNISVYFNPDVPESDILSIKSKLAGYQEIKKVDYVSKDQALDEFKALTNDDPSINQALQVIGENPLLPSLLIKANQPDQYQLISNVIQNNYGDKINRISYEENKSAIDRLNSIVRMVKEIGLILAIIFIVVAILVTFNTIRITIYSHRAEFEIMRLVGASNMYVEMPYIFEGIFYGVSAAVVSVILMLITVKFLSRMTAKFLDQGSLISSYMASFWLIFGILLFMGAGLGVISSFIAIRRYLKK